MFAYVTTEKHLDHAPLHIRALAIVALLALLQIGGFAADDSVQTGVSLEIVRAYDTDEDTVLLGEPGALGLHQSGKLYSLDAQMHQVHVWTREGAYIGAFGREGEGPGELALKSGIGNLLVYKDQVIVMDEQVSKFHYFHAETFQFIKTISRPRHLSRIYPFVNNGRVYAINRSNSRSLQEVVRLDENLAPEKTLFRTGFDRFEWIDTERFILRPYANSVIIASGREYIIIGQTSFNEFMVFKGIEEVKKFRAPLFRDSVTPEDKEYHRESLRNAGNNRAVLEFGEDKAYFSNILIFNNLIMIMKSHEEESRISGLLYDQQFQLKSRFDIDFGKDVNAGEHGPIDEITAMTDLDGELYLTYTDDEGSFRIVAFDVGLPKGSQVARSK